MKTLILIRHAKSSWANLDLSDFDRPLNERGLGDAPRMGKRFKEKSITPDCLITSPANRAYTTCKLFAEAINFLQQRIKTEKGLYHADEEAILEIVKNLKEPDNVIILFGHNPGFTDFANRLMNIRIDNVPTCGVVACKLPVKEWKAVTWGLGQFMFFDFPKSGD
ncbi:MAG: histidine phosphatase family protein [Cyclobacteriaceae bacterium]|nr:histidine phosphatase family protein [Cyclobacteriaceae bacterium]